MQNLLSAVTYFASFGISLFICRIYQNYCEQRNYEELPRLKKCIWLLLIISAPVFISTIRYGVGTDYFNYENIFNRVNTTPMELVIKRFGNEPLYLLTNKIAFFLFKEPWGVFLISSFIIHIFTIYGIDFFKKNISMPMSLFIFYMYHFSFGLNIIRQMIAVSIVFFSIRYLHQRKPLKYILSVVIASMFHNTAIICLLFYLIIYIVSYKNYFFKWMYMVLVLISPIIIPVGIKILMRIEIFSQYKKYIYSDFSLGIGYLIKIIPIFLPIFIYIKQIKKENPLFEPYVLLSLLNIPFQLIGYFVNVGSRLVYYTNIFYYLLPAILIVSLYKKEEKFIIKTYYISYFLLNYILNFIMLKAAEVYPYHLIF